jgi:hypothetical protein
MIINKNGPIVNKESIQAKIWPEIANTNCWIINTRKKIFTLTYFTRKIWKENYGLIPEKINNKRVCICHKCDNINGPCINPKHLFLGIDKDNIHDCIKKGRFKAAGTSESVLKGWENRRLKGNDKGHGGTSKGALKSLEIKRKTGINHIAALKAWKTKKKTGNTGILKGWETRRKLGNIHWKISKKRTVEHSKKIWEKRRTTENCKKSFEKGWETRRKKEKDKSNGI